MADPDPPDRVTPLPVGTRRCSICGKPSVPRYQPFCSVRCRNIDLGRWLKGNYRVETEEPPDEDSEPGEP